MIFGWTIKTFTKKKHYKKLFFTTKLTWTLLLWNIYITVQKFEDNVFFFLMGVYVLVCVYGCVCMGVCVCVLSAVTERNEAANGKAP